MADVDTEDSLKNSQESLKDSVKEYLVELIHYIQFVFVSLDALSTSCACVSHSFNSLAKEASWKQEGHFSLFIVARNQSKSHGNRTLVDIQISPANYIWQICIYMWHSKHTICLFHSFAGVRTSLWPRLKQWWLRTLCMLFSVMQ